MPADALKGNQITDLDAGTTSITVTAQEGTGTRTVHLEAALASSSSAAAVMVDPAANGVVKLAS